MKQNRTQHPRVLQNAQYAEIEKRTSMNISLTTEDKQFLKIYAAKHDTNVAAMIAQYVETLRNSEDK